MPFSGTEQLPPMRPSDAELAGPFDCCVVGAGIVGAPLATTLARQGRRVLLVGGIRSD